MGNMEEIAVDGLIEASFIGNVIKKDLMRIAGLNFLPRYVAEFILSTFLQKYAEEVTAIAEAKKFVYDNYPENNSSELLKHRLLEDGEIKILQKFKVKVDVSSRQYTATIPLLKDRIQIKNEFTNYYPALLTTGMWGLGKIKNNPTNKTYPLDLVDFNPFQIGSFDRKEFFEARANFTTLDQWLSTLIISFGLNPINFTKRQQLLIIARMIPLVSKNQVMAEFGPKSTGKTYQLRNHSSYSHVISGSSITPAKFAFDQVSGTPGLVSTADVIIFDEVTGADFGKSKDFEMIGLLKDYMEGGNVTRGTKEINEDASIVFIGNIQVKESRPKFEDFVRELPHSFRDTAFIDRIQGMIPGWEIPKIAQTDIAFTDQKGLMSNYIGEAFHNLRKWDHPSFRWNEVETNLLNIRNEKAVMNITSGLIKILYPGVEIDKHDINLCLKIATHLRQNVYDQLNYQEPDEFKEFSLFAQI
ncbi:MAG: BREX system Lon protease-like protein BrxL [Candidatus Heimdallarchaeota archaeon]|nr:BREX system Lon protease-like protein BrxL [Candidatus Heimdallarchaeota archaeon]